MAAIPKAKLAELEQELGLEVGELTYQQRCSRLAAVQRGEAWELPKGEEPKRGTVDLVSSQPALGEAIKQHPLYGKRLLFTPLMTNDKNRALYFDEPLGPEIEVEEIQAGTLLYGAPEDVDRMVGDYKVVRTNRDKIVTARTSVPKSGQEISWAIGQEICPVVRGNDGQKGYIWIIPTQLLQVGGTMVQVMGLKTLITSVAPELLPKFSGKPVMMSIDGLVMAASIPQTDAILKEYRRKEMQDAKLGLG